MSIPVESILARLKDLEIEPVLRGQDLVLRAKPGAITERCKQVVRENKAAIIEHLSKPIPFEQQIAAIFSPDCTITMQKAGTTLEEHIAAHKNGETHVSQKEKKSNWTPEEWQAACELQDRRVKEYKKRLGTPILTSEVYMGEDGFMVVPEYDKWKRSREKED